jgi:hypothetical protein
VPKQAVPNNERKNRIDDFIDRHTQAGHKLVLVKLYAPGNSQSKLEVQQLKSNINICHRAFARLIQTKPLKLIKGFVRVTKIAWDYSLQKPLPYLYILFSFGSEEDYKYIDWNKVWQKSYGQKDTQAKSVAYIPVLFDEFLFSYTVDEIPSKKLDVVFVAVKGLKLVSVSRGDKKPDEESPEDAAA